MFLKSLIGLRRPEQSSIAIDGTNILVLQQELYAPLKLPGMPSQDGKLFGSIDLYDNVAFPLR